MLLSHFLYFLTNEYSGFHMDEIFGDSEAAARLSFKVNLTPIS